MSSIPPKTETNSDLTCQLDGIISETPPNTQETSITAEVFVIGGGQIYKKFIELDIIDKIYLTVVFTAINNGDTYVNIPNLIKWNTIQNTIITESDDLNEFRTKFTIYSKN